MLLVVIYHFSDALMQFHVWYDLGVFIVFFFVLSSYLITRILLGAKEKALDRGVGRGKVAAVFLLRRTLRIFPAYYLYLIVLMLFPAEGHEAREHAGMYFFHLANIQLYLTKTWGTYTVHFWTLSVEEQFYLIWPWLILFVPNRYLVRVLVALIISGVLFRIGMTTLMKDQMIEIFPMLSLTPACIDCFAAGALLAYYHRQGVTENRWLKWVMLAVIPLWLFLILSHHRRWFLGMDRVFVSLLSVLIIDTANRGYKGVAGQFLENGVVQYLSKISYGIYIYHLISPVFVRYILVGLKKLFPSGGFLWLSDISQNSVSGFLLYLLVSIGCASISWYCLEQPVNQIKSFFGYALPGNAKKANDGPAAGARKVSG